MEGEDAGAGQPAQLFQRTSCPCVQLFAPECSSGVDQGFDHRHVLAGPAQGEQPLEGCLRVEGQSHMLLCAILQDPLSGQLTNCCRRAQRALLRDLAVMGRLAARGKEPGQHACCFCGPPELLQPVSSVGWGQGELDAQLAASLHGSSLAVSAEQTGRQKKMQRRGKRCNIGFGDPGGQRNL